MADWFALDREPGQSWFGGEVDEPSIGSAAAAPLSIAASVVAPASAGGASANASALALNSGANTAVGASASSAIGWSVAGAGSEVDGEAPAPVIEAFSISTGSNVGENEGGSALEVGATPIEAMWSIETPTVLRRVHVVPALSGIGGSSGGGPGYAIRRPAWWRTPEPPRRRPPPERVGVEPEEDLPPVEKPRPTSSASAVPLFLWCATVLPSASGVAASGPVRTSSASPRPVLLVLVTRRPMLTGEASRTNPRRDVPFRRSTDLAAWRLAGRQRRTG